MFRIFNSNQELENELDRMFIEAITPELEWYKKKKKKDEGER